MSQEAFPPLWRALGLSVAIGYAGLGSYAAFLPITGANEHGLRAPNSSPQNDEYVKTAMAWIGARDISIAAALFAFYYQDKPREMGTVILSGMILCITDSVLIWRARRDWYAAFITAGAAGWAIIGWGLLGLGD